MNRMDVFGEMIFKKIHTSQPMMACNIHMMENARV